MYVIVFFFFFQAEDGIRDLTVTGVQTCALPISLVARACATPRLVGRTAEGDGMTCAEASRLIGPWVDDELDVRSAMEIESHVARCAECGRERNELLALRDTARERLPRYELSPEVEERLW